MIGHLKGRIVGTGADRFLIDVNGVGYVVQAGSRLLSRLVAGETAEVHIETQMSENAIKLYGFESDEARAWFVRLQDVPGVGAKASMAILDVMAPPELMDAIALEDASSVARAKGVGKKIAERVTKELNGKPPPMGLFGTAELPPLTGSGNGAAAVQSSASHARNEAVSALCNLGYGQSEAARAVAKVAKDLPDDAVGDVIKAALKELAP